MHTCVALLMIESCTLIMKLTSKNWSCVILHADFLIQDSVLELLSMVVRRITTIDCGFHFQCGFEDFDCGLAC